MALVGPRKIERCAIAVPILGIISRNQFLNKTRVTAVLALLKFVRAALVELRAKLAPDSRPGLLSRSRTVAG